MDCPVVPYQQYNTNVRCRVSVSIVHMSSERVTSQLCISCWAERDHMVGYGLACMYVVWGCACTDGMSCCMHAYAHISFRASRGCAAAIVRFIARHTMHVRPQTRPPVPKGTTVQTVPHVPTPMHVLPFAPTSVPLMQVVPKPVQPSPLVPTPVRMLPPISKSGAVARPMQLDQLTVRCLFHRHWHMFVVTAGGADP